MLQARSSRQDLPRRIDGKAQAEPPWRFWGREVPVGTLEPRRAASRVAKADNGAPGMDGGRGEASAASGGEAWREPLRDALGARTSHPLRGRRQAIPKDGGTTVRVLGLPTRRDRVGHGALQLRRAPMVEADGPPGS